MSSASHYYDYVPESIYSFIATSRKIDHPDQNLKNFLIEYDQRNPQWINKIVQTDLKDLAILDIAQLYVWGAIKRVNLKTIALEAMDLLALYQILFLSRDPQYAHMKGTLKFFVMKAKRQVLEAYLELYNINSMYSVFIPNEDIINFIFNGVSPELSKYSTYAQRHHRLLAHPYRQILAQHYMLSNDSDWVKIACKQPSNIELKLDELNVIGIDQFCSKYGIMIPHYMDKNTYIRQNFLDYSNLFQTTSTPTIIPLDKLLKYYRENISSYLSTLSDLGIFNYCKAYLPYTSRSMLVNAGSNFIRGVSTFFYPYPKEDGKYRNTTTFIGNEVNDPTIFTLAFGTMNSYYLYEPIELVYSFTPDGDGYSAFRYPEDRNRIFSENELTNLLILCKSFTSNEDLNKLITTIQTGFEFKRERTLNDRNLIEALRGKPKEDTDLLLKFLIRTFECGMYMRRWPGPGFPYPLLETDTLIRHDPESNSIEALHNMLNYYERMPPTIKNVVHMMTCCIYRPSGVVDFTNERLKKWWDDVVEGKACIRQASSNFVATSYRYAKVLFNYTIPDCDMKMMVSIS